MKSPDSDVFLYYWLMLVTSGAICCFKQVLVTKRELLNIKKLAEEHGPEKCSAPFGLHAFTGCDSTSAFKVKGKVKPLKMLLSQKFESYVTAFKKIGTSWTVDDTLIAPLEEFVCALYGSTKCSSVDELRLLTVNSKCREKDFTLQWS